MQTSGDVSPTTKSRNYRNPGMATDVGKVCKRCMPQFAPFAAFSPWVFPQWGSRAAGEPMMPMGPSISSPRTASRAAGDGCYRGELGEQGWWGAAQAGGSAGQQG